MYIIIKKKLGGRCVGCARTRARCAFIARHQGEITQPRLNCHGRRNVRYSGQRFPPGVYSCTICMGAGHWTVQYIGSGDSNAERVTLTDIV